MKIKSTKECVIVDDKRVLFSVKERGKTFVLKHSSSKKFSCRIVDVDKCCFANSELKRCDYLFIVPKTDFVKQSMAYFVELKGNDLNTACEQLFNSVDKLKSEISEYVIRVKLIATKGFQPEITSNQYYRRLRKLIKKSIEIEKVHKGNLFSYVENI